MSIETKIEGDPESIRATASWVRDSLASRVTDTASAIYRARNAADGGWRGDAFQGFRTDMTHGAGKADDFGPRGKTEAQEFESIAAALQRAQSEMDRIRGEASAAGLAVNGDVIADPGPAPAAPGPAPTGNAATPQAANAHGDAVAAAQAHDRQVEAYERLNGEADSVRRHWAQVVQQLNKRANDANKNAFFSITDVAANTTAAAAAAAKHSSILVKEAAFRADLATKLTDHAKAMGATDPTGFYKNLDDADAQTRAASKATDDAAKANQRGKAIGLKAGGILAGAGIVYDITQGNPVDQAVVSGGVGFGAFVAAGALIGSAIPVPVVGTALGAIGGAAVGVFTSGAIDSMYEMA